MPRPDTTGSPLLPPGEASPIRFLSTLTVSQWLLLAYPVFMYLVSRRRDADDVAQVDGSAVAQIVFTGVCGMHAFARLAMRRWTGMSLVRSTPLKWLANYLGLAMLSTLWSDMKVLTAFRSVQAMIFLLIVLDALGTFKSIDDLIRYQIWYSVVAALFVQFIPLQLNVTLGNLHNALVPGTVVGSVFLGLLLRGTAWRWMHAIVVVAFVTGTSSGAFLGGLCGIGGALMLNRGQQAKAGGVLMCLLIGLVLMFPDHFVGALFYGKESKEVYSATGRLPTWQWVLEERVATRPIVGFGFAAGEAQARLSNDSIVRMIHMHSAQMSALVNLGALGAGLMLLLWIGVARDATRAPTAPLRAALMGASIAIVVSSIAMESITGPVCVPWVGHAQLFGTVVCARKSAPITPATRRAAGPSISVSPRPSTHSRAPRQRTSIGVSGRH